MSRFGQTARRLRAGLRLILGATLVLQCFAPWPAPMMPAAQAAPPSARQSAAAGPAPLLNVREAARNLSPILGIAPQFQGPNRVVLDRSSGADAEDSCRVVLVSGGDGALLFQMVAGGNVGLDVAREFFESPFFTRSETEELYGLFSRARAGVRQRVGRYEVGMKLATRAGRFELTMRFVPRR